MTNRDTVLSYVKGHGPVIPSAIKKALGSDTTLLGAMLSELAAHSLLKISNTKIGGSPFYYVSGQEPKLEHLQQYLGEKDRRTASKLKQEKVIRDKAQDPLTRVSLRQIKDFSIPFEELVNGEKELFWKYYLTTEVEAQEHTKKILLKDKVVEHLVEQIQKPQEQPVETTVTVQAPQVQQVVQQPPQVLQDDTFIQLKKEVTPEVKQEKPVVKQKQEAINPVQEQKTLTPKEKVEETEFWKSLESYFKKNNIEVVDQKVIRKNSEYDLTINIPSAVGNLTYFCKAKKKKKTNDGDLSSLYLKASSLKLPVLYLTTGDLTKKAKELLAGELKSITVKSL